MADPAITDPATATGIVAAMGAIGLAIRAKRGLNRQRKPVLERRLWLTLAARAVTERAVGIEGDVLDGQIDEQPEIDLTPTGVASDVDLRDAEEIDLLDQPTIDLTRPDQDLLGPK